MYISLNNILVAVFVLNLMSIDSFVFWNLFLIGQSYAFETHPC